MDWFITKGKVLKIKLTLSRKTFKCFDGGGGGLLEAMFYLHYSELIGGSLAVLDCQL